MQTTFFPVPALELIHKTVLCAVRPKKVPKVMARYSGLPKLLNDKIKGLHVVEILICIDAGHATNPSA